jgi:hypothetical protein
MTLYQWALLNKGTGWQNQSGNHALWSNRSELLILMLTVTGKTLLVVMTVTPRRASVSGAAGTSTKGTMPATVTFDSFVFDHNKLTTKSRCFWHKCFFQSHTNHSPFGLCPSLGILKNTIFRKLDVSEMCSLEYWMMDNVLIPSVIHHCQNPLESIYCSVQGNVS